jgi:hypothetical protein
LESSNYFDNQGKISDLNSGMRSEDLIMYQSEHENYDLEGNVLAGDSTKGRNGWPTTIISDRSRVYKGGSWADRAYWLSAGNRRFLDEDKSSDAIGFRCAMDRLGSPTNGNRRK